MASYRRRAAEQVREPLGLVATLHLHPPPFRLPAVGGLTARQQSIQLVRIHDVYGLFEAALRVVRHLIITLISIITGRRLPNSPKPLTVTKEL